jgi:hypothetical protein
MTNTMKLVGIAVPVVVGVGVASAVLLGGGRQGREATIASGTVLVGALQQSVSTDKNRVGDVVEVRAVEPLPLADGAALPAGAVLRGEVTHVKNGGRIAGAPELTLRFSELEVDGDQYPVSVEPFRVTGKSDATESAAEIGGGAVAGGLLGGIKGAVAGAAIGTGVAVVTEGDRLALIAGQKVRLRFTEAATVRYR